MELWIILHGEKRGPLQDYQVRQGIDNGDYEPTTPAWHEGMAEWKPLNQIELFKSWFEPPGPDDIEEEEEDFPASGPDPVRPPPLPAHGGVARHLVRRFWARWLDLYLFAGFWWLVMWFSGRDIEATLLNPWIMAMQYVPWFVLETILIHHYGTTPGKWLLGLEVRNADGSRLTLAESTRRALRVMIAGVGLGWGLLAVFCQGLSLFTTRRIGRPLWDHMGNHQVEVRPLRPARVVVVVVLYFTAMQMQMAVVSPYVMPKAAEMFPQLREQIEKNPPWHLPKRSE